MHSHELGTIVKVHLLGVVEVYPQLRYCKPGQLTRTDAAFGFFVREGEYPYDGFFPVSTSDRLESSAK